MDQYSAETLSPQETLDLLIKKKFNPTSHSETSFIDVRSESEYTNSPIPEFINLPILTDQERHLVGTAYKQQGKNAAIELGKTLTLPHREARILNWSQIAIQSKLTLLTCWRGGLRSKTALSWLKEKGIQATRIQGGTKALRTKLLNAFDELPPLIILSGMTGSGKTTLIQTFDQHSKPVIDLEKLANHRGSSFGLKPNESQPSQIAFENKLALFLFAHKKKSPPTTPILLEDESLLIGKLTLPQNLKDKMRKAPVIFLESTLEDRALRIFDEYVLGTLKKYSLETAQKYLLDSVENLRKRLGGLETDFIQKNIKKALENSLAKKSNQVLDFEDPEPHLFWIKKLLKLYYDPRYLYAFNRQNRPLLFRGNLTEIKEFFLQATPQWRTP